MGESKYEHGKMDISEHEKTFEGFLRASAWVAGGSLLLLVLLYLING